MAQPGGVELGDVQGMAPQLRLSLLAWWTLTATAVFPGSCCPVVSVLPPRST